MACARQEYPPGRRSGRRQACPGAFSPIFLRLIFSETPFGLL